MQAASLAEWGCVQHEKCSPEVSVTPGQTRPWLLFTVHNIRLFGNNKLNAGPVGKEYGRRNTTKLGINLCRTSKGQRVLCVRETRSFSRETNENGAG